MKMEQIPKSYEYFIACLQHIKEAEGTGFQSNLALTVDRSEPYISKVINQKAIASFNLQNQIAEACGYEYDEFLSMGKKIAQGSNPQEKITHIDPAVQILNESLEETGVEISEKQKRACLTIIREELAKSDSKTKDDIKKYLKAFGE